MQACDRCDEESAESTDDEGCTPAEKTLEMARIELNRVMVERKTHEKLRERAFEEFKQEIAQAESKEIDELVSYNYHEG